MPDTFSISSTPPRFLSAPFSSRRLQQLLRLCNSFFVPPASRRVSTVLTACFSLPFVSLTTAVTVAVGDGAESAAQKRVSAADAVFGCLSMPCRHAAAGCPAPCYPRLPMPASPACPCPADAHLPANPMQEVRSKLLRFLKESEHYTPEKFLSNPVFEELLVRFWNCSKRFWNCNMLRAGWSPPSQHASH